MNERDKDLMERYIYEVVRRVPASQKEDIRMELQELIDDMYDAEGADMEKILSKLGDPAELAKKYRDDNNYVIGPEYYENYVWVLKIVMICVAASSLLSRTVSLIMSSGHNVFDFSGDLLGGLMSAFGMVTLVFAVMERLKVKVDIKTAKVWSIDNLKGDSNQNKKVWSPDQMSPVPDKKGLISRGETIFGIVFIAIFGAMLIFTPQLFGAYVFDDGKLVRTISVFNLEEWNRILPILIMTFFVSFIDEIIKLVAGCYSVMVMAGTIVTAVIQLALATVALKVLPIWNPNFIAEVSQQFDINFTSKGDILTYWGTGAVSNILLAIIYLATLLEVGTAIYKTMRYGVKN